MGYKYEWSNSRKTLVVRGSFLENLSEEQINSEIIRIGEDICNMLDDIDIRPDYELSRNHHLTLFIDYSFAYDIKYRGDENPPVVFIESKKDKYLGYLKQIIKDDENINPES